MKKILILVMFSGIASISFSEGRFNFPIPQPDMISNDYDGDGKINSIDEDDDGDGILDINDDIPFGRPSSDSKIEEESGITSFTTDMSEIFLGQSVNFSWNIERATNLTLFGGSIDNFGSDVTGLNSTTDSPIEDTTYTLYSDTGNKSVDVDVLPEPVVNDFAINNLSSGAIEITSGNSVNITWNITGGKNIYVTGGNLLNQNNLSNIGAIIDNPIVDTIYTLFDGLSSTSLSVILVDSCDFYIKDNSQYWDSRNKATMVLKNQSGGAYLFYKNGIYLGSNPTTPSLLGYYAGDHMGKLNDYVYGSGEIHKVFKLCEN